MKNLSLYSVRFRVLEIISYFLLLLPWLPGLLRRNTLPYGTLMLTVKIVMSAAIVIFIFLLRDVRKKMHSLDVLKQDMAMSAIHDLKGPLTSIIGALSIISEPEIDPVTRDNLLSIAAQSAHSMVKLIQIMVDTERMEIAKLLLQPRRFGPREHLLETIKPFHTINPELGITLTTDVAKDMPDIYADKDLLTRVYENLLLNAYKYSRRGAEVRINARFAEGKFLFEVRDTGMGIPADQIKSVFDKYYRVDGQEKDVRKGSGLGLYFCRLAIEAHHGNIKIESKIGAGTTVIFELPQPS